MERIRKEWQLRLAAVHAPGLSPAVYAYVAFWGLVAALGLFGIQNLPPLQKGPIIPLWLFVPIFLILENVELNVPLSNHSCEITITQVVVFVGLWSHWPIQVILLMALGKSLSVLPRKAPVIKALFNTFIITAANTLAIWVFYALSNTAAPFSLSTVMALSLACLIVAAGTTAALLGIIYLTGGKFSKQTFMGQGFVVLLDGGLGLVMTLLVWQILFSDAWLLFALLPIMLLIVYSFRLVGQNFQENHVFREQLNLSGMLRKAGDVQGAIYQFLDGAMQLERAGAAFLFLSIHEQNAFWQVGLRTGKQSEAEILTQTKSLLTLFPDYGATLVTEVPQLHHDVFQTYLQRVGLTNGMAVSVPYGSEKGLLVLGNRLAQHGHYNPHQLQTLKALAVQLGALFQNEATEAQLVTLSKETGRMRMEVLTDPLTALANRTALEDRLRHAIARAKDTPTVTALMFVDLDGFKAVNDTFGHAGGDFLLQTVGQRMLATVRETDTVARFGGDEFVILLEGVTEAKAATEVAERLLHRLSEPIGMKDDKAAQVGGSIGLVWAVGGDDSVETFVAAADKAMYEAKKGGKGRVVTRQLESAQ